MYYGYSFVSITNNKNYFILVVLECKNESVNVNRFAGERVDYVLDNFLNYSIDIFYRSAFIIWS